jgi:hypothetical protein
MHGHDEVSDLNQSIKHLDKSGPPPAADVEAPAEDSEADEAPPATDDAEAESSPPPA